MYFPMHMIINQRKAALNKKEMANDLLKVSLSLVLAGTGLLNGIRKRYNGNRFCIAVNYAHDHHFIIVI